MATVHVFAMDWVPQRDEPASGGGLRSRQVIEALRDAGHRVTCSVPTVCRHVRSLGRNHPELRNVLLHDQDNQVDVLRETRPEVVVWMPGHIRNVPLTGLGDIVHVADMIGLPHIEATAGMTGLATRLRQRVVQLCAGADLVLTGSEEQHGYWLAELTRDGSEPATAIVPYALVPELQGPGVSGAARLTRLHVTGMVYAWSTSVELLRQAAVWVGRRDGVTLSVIVGTDPGGATDLSVQRALNEIAAMPNVEMPGEVSFDRAMADYRSGSVALDLYLPRLERRLAVPIRTVNALLHGVPVLTTIDSTLTRQMASAGAAMIAADAAGGAIGGAPVGPLIGTPTAMLGGTSDAVLGGTLDVALDRLAALPPEALGRMSQAARDFAAQRFDAAASAQTLNAALEAALQRRAALRRRWQGRTGLPGRLGHVLVVSSVPANLRELRVDIPFGAMHGRGLISGFSVWSRDEFAFSTSADPARQDFHAIWVQREVLPDAAIALGALARPFVYDLDDHLLMSPSYRPAFPIEMQQATRNLIRSCRVFSCSTARLAQLLQGPAMESIVGKVVVTPSLLREQPGPRPTGEARFVMWASSDTPALTRSFLPVCKAIRDFCLSQGMGLVCIGAQPPALLAESGVGIQHVAQVPYGSYLSLLRSFAPAIMACPLETDADPDTAGFIAGKSDIKMLEALAAGFVGVFSRAPPYTDSDLPGAVLCDNSYAGWFDALGEAARRCASEPVAAATVPAERCAGTLGLWPWFDALSQVALDEPLPAAAFLAAVQLLRSRYGRRLLSELEFDETFYVRMYPDVQVAVDHGVVRSAYAHYASNGFREGRLGRPGDTAAPHNEQVWANLLHTLGDLRQIVDVRAQELEALKVRRAARLRLRSG